MLGTRERKATSASTARFDKIAATTAKKNTGRDNPLSQLARCNAATRIMKATILISQPPITTAKNAPSGNLRPINMLRAVSPENVKANPAPINPAARPDWPARANPRIEPTIAMKALAAKPKAKARLSTLETESNIRRPLLCDA